MKPCTERVLRLQKEVEQEAQGKMAVHLGCGPMVLTGFLNIDLYHEDKTVIKTCMSELPFSNNSMDLLYSNHALEHLSLRTGKRALIEWARVLKPNGKLYLTIPDLEEICRIMCNPDVPLKSKETWFIYTLFGYQCHTEADPNDLDVPLDMGQFHQSGYSKKSITHYLEEAGFTINNLFTFDGFNTPSIWVEATKR